jgi:flavodoxin
MATAVVVWESMFGNTRAVAEAVAEGLRAGGVDAQSSPVSECADIDMSDVDLLVVGGPTHVWGMSRPRTRAAAAEEAGRADSGRQLDSGATGVGLREWLESEHIGSGAAAAFDTRLSAPFVTGRASRRIRARLRRAGRTMIAGRESFLVTGDDVLHEGELDRARAWGRQLAEHRLLVPS